MAATYPPGPMSFCSQLFNTTWLHKLLRTSSDDNCIIWSRRCRKASICLVTPGLQTRLPQPPCCAWCVLDKIVGKIPDDFRENILFVIFSATWTRQRFLWRQRDGRSNPEKGRNCKENGHNLILCSKYSRHSQINVQPFILYTANTIYRYLT